MFAIVREYAPPEGKVAAFVNACAAMEAARQALATSERRPGARLE